MAKTLLNSVNEILKRTGTISGPSGELTAITDAGRQRHIDVAIQVINEGIDELYSASSMPLPDTQAESTITLVTSQQAYTLASDLVQLRWPLIDKTNNQYLTEFPGGYNSLLLFDPEQDDTGQPHWAVIRPTDGKLYLDRAPTSDLAGRVYTYQYDKDPSLSVATDEVPFGDAVFRAMVPAWVELWNRQMRRESDDAILTLSLGRAARLLTKKQLRASWSPR